MQVSDFARPYHAGTGPIGVLFCHGFTGSPWSLLEWAKSTQAAGHRVAVPRLPGHGTSWQEMNLTGWQDWYSCVEREFLSLRAQCDQVFITGLSMGGALALRLAEHYPDDVAGLVLVNPAVLGFFNTNFAPFLSKFVPSMSAIGSDLKDPDADEHAYDRTPLKAAASMLRMWVDVRACLDLVSCPIVVYRSATDHVVPASSTAFIMSHVSSEERSERILMNSYHVATMDHDKETIFRGTVEFIDEHRH